MSDNGLQADEALDSLGVVVGEIAHDFNNILSVISGYVEMALSELPEGERARCDLEHVMDASDRARKMVSRILTFSKSTRLQRKPISLNKPVAEAISYLNQRVAGNVKLTSHIEGSSGRLIESNEAEIYKIIINLCSNSLQALPDTGGDIEVAVNYFNSDSKFSSQYPGLTVGDFVRILVKDTGCGMNIDTMEKMYMPFFTTTRVDNNSRSRPGLGLTTVYNIVSSHNGCIFVDSAPGMGAKFEICLPLFESEARIDDDKPEVERSHDEVKRIMLVDDESTMLTMANKMLEQHGYTVTTFSDGNLALEHFREQPHEYDLVITDLIMPTISGTELASKLSAINPMVRIILITGFSEGITAAACAHWGIEAVVNKPFTVKELLAAIRG